MWVGLFEEHKSIQRGFTSALILSNLRTEWMNMKPFYISFAVLRNGNFYY